MRYTLSSKALSLQQIEAEVKKIGGKDIRLAPLAGFVFSELDPEQAERLTRLDIELKPVEEYRTSQVTAAQPAENLHQAFYHVRSYFRPPLSGTGLTVAVLDSGVRDSHVSLQGKVVYSKNLTGSPSARDVFGHGTQVAFLICGGVHAEGAKAGVAPGARVMSLKVINDEGVGTDEDLIMGIDEVCSLALQARLLGKLPSDDMFPNVINLSLGAKDDGKADNPVRIACRKAQAEYGIDVIASAGNEGPGMTTVTMPACDPQVIAVGGIQTLGELCIWEKSSRGPTVEGHTKPDFVLWATDIEAASHSDDEKYLVKSGTSFSAPLLSGLTGLLWESGRRAYGETWEFHWGDALEFAPYFCTKPLEAPLEKDNTYGYGLPAVGAWLAELSGARPAGSEALQMMAPMMGLAMVAMIVPSMRV